ncbi:hypothetical protein CICLE_v100061371mg, partial [Citrus x clementina]
NMRVIVLFRKCMHL